MNRNAFGWVAVAVAGYAAWRAFSTPAPLTPAQAASAVGGTIDTRSGGGDIIIEPGIVDTVQPVQTNTQLTPPTAAQPQPAAPPIENSAPPPIVVSTTPPPPEPAPLPPASNPAPSPIVIDTDPIIVNGRPVDPNDPNATPDPTALDPSIDNVVAGLGGN